MTDLIKRLEKAKAGSRELDAAIYDALGATRVRSCIAGLSDDVGGLWMYEIPGHNPSTALHVTTSLDAALALAERVLPGWRPMLLALTGYWQAHLAAPNFDYANDRTGRAPTPALALCIAILKATDTGRRG